MEGLLLATLADVDRERERRDEDLRTRGEKLKGWKREMGIGR
jgi:hypothetical protein